VWLIGADGNVRVMGALTVASPTVKFPPVPSSEVLVRVVLAMMRLLTR
jgi:hypothetical protein